MNKDPSIVDAEIVEDSSSTEQTKVDEKKSDDKARAEKSTPEQSEEKNELVARLLSAEHWLRFVFMVLFALVASVAAYVVAVLIVIQFLFALVTGTGEARLKSFGGGLSLYLFQILQYLTYNSDEKPFPFKDWPEVDDVESDELQG